MCSVVRDPGFGPPARRPGAQVPHECFKTRIRVQLSEKWLGCDFQRASAGTLLFQALHQLLPSHATESGRWPNRLNHRGRDPRSDCDETRERRLVDVECRHDYVARKLAILKPSGKAGALDER